MLGHERHHLAGDLQIRNITVEIDPVQRLDVQANMAIKQIVHRDCRWSGHDPSLRLPANSNQPQTRRSEAKPHWCPAPEVRVICLMRSGVRCLVRVQVLPTRPESVVNRYQLRGFYHGWYVNRCACDWRGAAIF